MSIALMTAVFRLELGALPSSAGGLRLVRPPALKITLLALADHAADDGTGVYPSQSTLCLKTGLSKSGLLLALDALETAGYLVRWKRASKLGTTYYRLVVDKLLITSAQRTPPKTTSAHSALPLARTVHQTSAHSALEPSLTHHHTSYDDGSEKHEKNDDGELDEKRQMLRAAGFIGPNIERIAKMPVSADKLQATLRDAKIRNQGPGVIYHRALAGEWALTDEEERSKYNIE